MSNFNAKMHLIQFQLVLHLRPHSAPQTIYLDLRGAYFYEEGEERKLDVCAVIKIPKNIL